MANSNFKREYASSMDSKYYFSADRLPAGKIGATASPQSPNQIGELTSRLNQGLKAVEVGAMNQRILDQIPEEHFKEMRRLGKLTGSEATLHAPIQDLDLAGFGQGQQGGANWEEFNREEAVTKLKSVIDRAHLMDINGNIPITVHAGTFPAQTWKKEGLLDEKGKKVKDKRSQMVMVNQDTGQIQAAKYEEKEHATGEKVIWTPERRMENLNHTSWDQEQHQISQLRKDLIEVEDRWKLEEREYKELSNSKERKLLTKEEDEKLKKLHYDSQRTEKYAEETYSIIRSHAEEMFNKYKKFGEPLDITRKEEYDKNTRQIREKQKEMEKESSKLKEIYNKLEKLKDTRNIDKELIINYREKQEKVTDLRQEQTDLIVRNIDLLPAPKTWVPIDDFAKEKVSNSIAEAASYAYKKYGKGAPIISMENVYPEFALSRADSLKETIEEAKEKFTDKIMKEQNMSKKKAEEIANKIIGVTWDVGHIYMLKKHGYSDEDIEKEAKKIGAHVTHVHLTDNFGFEDSHLPPGEGSVNIKEQLRAIEESMSDEKKQQVKSIVEAGEFVANFKEVPHLYALSNLNSPLYTDDLGPTWDKAWDTQGHYMSGFGEIMPQKYFDLYGAPGFAQLPRELGGTAGSPDRGRFAASNAGEEE